MKVKASKIIIYWSKVFLIALLAVLIIRSFFIESFSVSSSQMETALLRGDRVLVNRTSYGIRMPVTVLAVPFAFDNVFGHKSYSTLIEFDYHRYFTSPVQRNDVIVFNNPLETDKPLDRRSLCISRCVAIPGETIDVKGYNYEINGKQYVTSPDFLLRFRFDKARVASISKVARSLDIPLRNFAEKDSVAYASFNRYEAFLINQNFSDSLKIDLAEKELTNYKILIPKKGMKMKMNQNAIGLYKNIIQAEVGKLATFNNNKLQLNGIEQATYTFSNDYFWFLSDNVEESVDSRAVGFISERDIIGKATYIWYSANQAEGIRWSRMFCKVK